MEGSRATTVLFDLRGQLLLPAAKARVPMSRFSPSTHFLTRVKAPAQFLKCICSTRYRRDVCCARNYILLATQKHKKILLLFDLWKGRKKTNSENSAHKSFTLWSCHTCYAHHLGGITCGMDCCR